MKLGIHLPAKPARHYPIVIETGILQRLFDCLQQHVGLATTYFLVSDEVVWGIYGAHILAQAQAAHVTLHYHLIPAGETSKNRDELNQIHTWLLSLQAKRGHLLIALGGGVVGDLAGFAAASYQRGMNFVQVPTTLLAQVDSSVGGKVAINHPLGKNMIGAFYQPLAVLIDINSLDTLPAREYSAGLAEIIKYGCIRDLGFFVWLEEHAVALSHREPLVVTEAIARSCQHKAEVVAADETEQGLRALLNFGHTFGHAIETGLGYGTWLHGEAVAAGMVAASRVSTQLGRMPADATERLIALLKKLDCPTEMPCQISPERYWQLMSADKKNTDDRMTFILLNGLGNAEVVKGLSPTQINAAYTVTP
jgi:3-dehydroquinate synthase